ncbi:MAG: guanylate kinase [Bacillota bacterium]|nr:guanylate kinase [Bacillota bacterium]
MEKGLLIILSGPSGVGKGTVRMEILKRKEINLFYSVSLTTRKMRPGEMDGREYYFVDDAEFQKNIENGNLLEWAGYVGHRYGTPKDKVEQMRRSGMNVLLEIDVTGAMQVFSNLKDDDGVVSIFLCPPSMEDLEKRIRGRGTESESTIKWRMERAEIEMNEEKHYQYVVTNDSVERAADEIVSIIKRRSAALNSK